MSTNVSLTPDIEKYAKNLVASGFYSSMSEVVREALRLHRKHENLYLRELHKELSLAADQIDNGQTQPHNMQDIIDRVDNKRSQRA
ncbi:MAG: type II toxin-antitoxin system ParD family antitoxin [Candidatus Anammoxibacter sp.]